MIARPETAVAREGAGSSAPSRAESDLGIGLGLHRTVDGDGHLGQWAEAVALWRAAGNAVQWRR